MKKHFMIFAVAFLAIAIAAPAFAAVEFKYGGQFRMRWFAQDNVFDGTETRFSPNYNSNDNRNILDHRLRLFFQFVGSKNLKVVVGFEIGDSVWGQSGAANNTGHNLGGNLGGDAVAVEVKNLYMQFNIPNTPSTAIVGLQPLVLMDGWIVNDDLPAAVLATNLEPFKVTVGYVGGQNGYENALNGTGVFGNNFLNTTTWSARVDDVFLSLQYEQGPFKASLIGLGQFANMSSMSIDPRTLGTPLRTPAGASQTFFNDGLFQAQDNNLFDLGFNFTYKIDWLLAYVNFVKNLGGVDLNNSVAPLLNTSADYTGFMIDAGVTYFCGPYTFNVGGFYTTGAEFADTGTQFVSPLRADGTVKKFNNIESGNVEWFTYPAGTSKAFSEIVGGGILGEDLHIMRGFSSTVQGRSMGNPTSSDAQTMRTVYWRGYYNPTNLWTITAGASWQVMEGTKISASYWYFGTAEEVPVTYNFATDALGKSSSIGHELDLYVDQKIVDGLTLTLVGAYLFADDAWAPLPATTNLADWTTLVPAGSTTTRKLADDSFEVGARLQWNF